jgi:hypothetical protein
MARMVNFLSHLTYSAPKIAGDQISNFKYT